MQNLLEELATRRSFGMKPGLDAIKSLSSALGKAHEKINAIHVAGTNGKGAVCAILDATLRAAKFKVGRYTSPHLVKINERFFLDGKPIDDSDLINASAKVSNVINSDNRFCDITFFEALTAIAFLLYQNTDYTILETGLGGRLDATNICKPALTIITRIGLDHCDWLGSTIEKIAFEKAGIIKSNVPVVVGENEKSVIEIIKARAKELNAPFYYARDIVSDNELPTDCSLKGSFNCENLITAYAALKVLSKTDNFDLSLCKKGFNNVVWPGRFHSVGKYLIDGAHNPPAARALVNALKDEKFKLIAGFCSDKDIDETLKILSTNIECAYAVKTNNSRSIEPKLLADKMNRFGMNATTADSLQDAIDLIGEDESSRVLICGSLFLAGEALVRLGAYPWGDIRFDSSELLKAK